MPISGLLGPFKPLPESRAKTKSFPNDVPIQPPLFVCGGRLPLNLSLFQRLLRYEAAQGQAEFRDLFGISGVRRFYELPAEPKVAVRLAPINLVGQAVEHTELLFFHRPKTKTFLGPFRGNLKGSTIGSLFTQPTAWPRRNVYLPAATKAEATDLITRQYSATRMPGLSACPGQGFGAQTFHYIQSSCGNVRSFVGCLRFS